MSEVGDIIDRANDLAQAMLDAQIADARRPLPPGEAGTCQHCDEYKPRLIGGACARCRDELGLP